MLVAGVKVFRPPGTLAVAKEHAEHGQLAQQQRITSPSHHLCLQLNIVLYI